MELGPGRPPAKPMKDGGVITVANTSPPVDSDELTNALDADTRDYFDLFVSGFAQGTDGPRAGPQPPLPRPRPDRASRPSEITGALAARRDELKRLVTNLAVLTKAAATKDEEIGERRADRQRHAGGRRQPGGQPARQPRTGCPARCRASARASTTPAVFSDELGPTLDAPAAGRPQAAGRAARHRAAGAQRTARSCATKLRPLVRELQPLARDLGPTTAGADRQTPDLSRAFQVLNYAVNALAFNPRGQRRGLPVLARLVRAQRRVDAAPSQDAQGAVTRGLALFSCDSLAVRTACSARCCRPSWPPSRSAR